MGKVSLNIQFTKDRIECFDDYFLVEKREMQTRTCDEVVASICRYVQ